MKNKIAARLHPCLRLSAAASLYVCLTEADVELHRAELSREQTPEKTKHKIWKVVQRCGSLFVILWLMFAQLINIL